MVEISQPGYFGHPGQSLGYEENTMGLDLLKLDFQVKRCPEERVSSELVESPADSRHTVQIFVTQIAQDFQQDFRGQKSQADPIDNNHLWAPGVASNNCQNHVPSS